VSITTLNTECNKIIYAALTGMAKFYDYLPDGRVLFRRGALNTTFSPVTPAFGCTC
jgi:hypothetical protein